MHMGGSRPGDVDRPVARTYAAKVSSSRMRRRAIADDVKEKIAQA
jgi:hypothetical protein